MELGLVLLPSNTTNATSLPAQKYLRFRAQSAPTTIVPTTVIWPVPSNWTSPLHMEIKAFNLTHYSFSAGPAGHMSAMQTIGYGAGSVVSYGFTGTLVGVYATTNGMGGYGTRENATKAYVSNWVYQGQGQFRN